MNRCDGVLPGAREVFTVFEAIVEGSYGTAS